jgi:hypothetical protein
MKITAMTGQINKQRALGSASSQVWSFVRFLEMVAFVAGMLIGAAVISDLQSDTNPALQAKRIFDMVRDVSPIMGGKTSVTDQVDLGNPDAIMYVFACRDFSELDADCPIDTCDEPTTLKICVCENKKSLLPALDEATSGIIIEEGKSEGLHGCEENSYQTLIRGSVRIQGPTRIRVEKKTFEGTLSTVISEVVG